MRWLRIVLLFVGGVVAVAIAALAGAWVFARTDAGQALLTARLNASLAGQVRIDGLSGDLPFHPRIARLALLDPDGTWATIADIAVDVAPLDLLRGRATIDAIRVASVEVTRPPRSAAPPPAQPAPPAIPTVPRLPLNIDLQHLDIAAIALDQSLLGQAVGLVFHASATVVDGRAAIAFSLARTDGQPGRAEGKLDLAGDPAVLGAHLHIDEPEGLLLQRLLQRPGPLPLSVGLDGDGPLSGWHGALVARAGDQGRLDATIDLAQRSDGLHAAIAGSVAAQPLLPLEIGPAIGPALHFDMAATASPDGAADLTRFDVAADSVRLQGSGKFAGDNGPIALVFRVTVPALGRFASLAGLPLAGAGELTATLAGTTDRPNLKLGLRGSGLAVAGIRFDSASADISAVPTAAIEDPAMRIAITGRGQVSGVVPGGQALPAGLGDAVAWQLDGNADIAGQSLEITQLDVNDAGVVVTGKGSFDLAHPHAVGNLTATIDQLGRFAELAGTRLAGRAAITAQLRSDDLKTGRAAIAGDFNDLTTGVPAADTLLGRHVAVRADAIMAADGSLALDNVAIDGAALRLTGKGSLGADLQTVQGNFAVVAPSLAVLAKAGMPAKGRLRVDGRVGGSLAAPTIDARIEATDAGWQQSSVDSIAAQLSAKAGNSPTARLNARFREQDMEGTLAAEAAYDPARHIATIPKLVLDAQGSRIEASGLRVSLDRLLASGTVNAHIPDLGPWSKLAGMPLGGRVDLDLGLAGQNGQNAKFTLAGNGLRATPEDGGVIALGRVRAAGTLTDLLRQPAGSATLDLADLEAGEARIDTAHLDIHSTGPGHAGFNLSLAGRAAQPIAITAGGELGYDRGALAARLAHFSGSVAGYPLKLERTLDFASHGGDMSVSGLDLALGPGRITGNASLSGPGVTVALAAEKLPIALAGKFAGRPGLEGSVDAHVDVTGALDRPEGHATVTLQRLRFAGDQQDVPAIGANLQADLHPGEVALAGDIDGPGGKVTSFTGTLPLLITRTPLSASLPSDRPIAAKLSGDGDLRNFAAFLPLGGDRLAGHFRVDAAVGGTMASPEISGGITLTGGRYEDLSSGLILDNAELELAGDRDHVTLRRFAATDGAKGTVAASGRIALADPGGPSLDATAKIQNFRAARRDDASATVSGDIVAAGPLRAPRLSGTIQVDEADLAVPDRLPPSAQKLDVVVIGKDGKVVESPPAQPAAATVGAVKLEVRILVPGQTFVRGRGLDSEWKGDLHIGGTSDAPDIAGRLTVVHGTLSFLGKDFALKQGVITFTGGPKIEPQLDFTAEADANGITARVRVTGTAGDPKITLSSTPALPQDEILAHLLFGSDMAHITPAQGLQLAQGLQSLASGGPDLLGKVRKRLGLDVLSVGSTNPNGLPSQDTSLLGGAGSTSNPNAGDTSVSAGKYIASGVYVGVQQGMSGETRTTVNIDLLPHVSASSSVGVRGGNDVGLNWKMDY